MVGGRLQGMGLGCVRRTGYSSGKARQRQERTDTRWLEARMGVGATVAGSQKGRGGDTLPCRSEINHVAGRLARRQEDWECTQICTPGGQDRGWV